MAQKNVNMVQLFSLTKSNWRCTLEGTTPQIGTLFLIVLVLIQQYSYLY